MTAQNSVGALLINPKEVATGEPEGDSLENENTNILGNGVLCYVGTGVGKGLWQLDKYSTATPDGTTIVEPIAGPGRWLKVSGGGIPGLTVNNVEQLVYQSDFGSNNTYIEQITTVIDGTNTTVSRSKVIAILDGVDETPIEYVVSGLSVNGITPEEVNTTIETNRLVAEITVTVNRADGSSWKAQKWIATWRYVDDATGYAAESVYQLSDATGPNTTTLTATVTGTPALPTVLIGQSSTADQPRYMIDSEVTLIKPIS